MNDKEEGGVAYLEIRTISAFGRDWERHGKTQAEDLNSRYTVVGHQGFGEPCCFSLQDNVNGASKWTQM